MTENRFRNVQFICHWNPAKTCENEHMCTCCEYQPADDDKPNGRKDPIKINWETGYGGTWPQCPACGEMPYDTERCTFCGQRFIQDDPELQEYMKPTEDERMDCPMCGGHGTMVGTRARSNGHFHGHCEKCGCRIME